jgi:nucleotide-binding universal stress UspA family protein
MFRTILVPLDGSALAEQALAMAAMVAARAGGATAVVELVLVDTNAMRSSAPDAHGDTIERIYINGIAEEASRLLGVPVAGIVVPGDPATAIVSRANEISADLIVMTTHGRTGLRRALLGSVADAVIRDAGRPILLRRPVPDGQWRRAVPRGFTRIVVALDGSDEATTVIGPVLDLCRWMEARPTLARVVYPVVELTFSEAGVPGPSVVDEQATQFAVDQAQNALSELALDIESGTRIPVNTSVDLNNDVAGTLLDVARRTKADLIALFTHSRRASRLIAESVSDRILRNSDVPLLMLHPRHEAARVGTEPARDPAHA